MPHDRSTDAPHPRAPFFAGIGQDLRFALRALARRPGFTAAVVATMALGIGANAAIFSVVDAALLEPLPFAEPGRLVHLWTTSTRGEGRSEASYPDFLDVRERTRSFTAVGGYHTARVTLATRDQALVLHAAKVTANFFDVLGVAPHAGRRFVAGEDALGAPRVAMITHALWQRAFGGERDVVGRAVQLDGVPYDIVGVLPPDYQFAGVGSAEVYAPLDRPPVMRERRQTHWLKPVARLAPGASAEEAGRDLARIFAELEREHPETNATKTMTLVPLRDELVGVVRPLLLTLYASVAFVLLVACGNVANLLLMRGAARQRELSIRAALGAGRARIARQLLTESGLLALAGGVLGIGVAWLGIRGLLAAIPPEQARLFPYLRNVGIGPTVLAYAAIVAVVAGVASGLLPALRASGTSLQATLRQGSGGSSTGGQRLLRDGLVVAELALTVMLLSGAALFGRSLARLLDVDIGVRADRVLTAAVPLPRWKYTSDAMQRGYYHALVERVGALPGVRAAGMVSKLPLDWGNSTSYAVVGAPAPAPGEETSASFRIATPGYFAAMGIPFVHGRTFLAAEDTTVPRVVIVNRTLARRAFGDADPVGRQLDLGGRTATIVGVVGDVTIGRLEDEIPPTMYYSSYQTMDVAMRLAVQTAGDPYAVAAPIRAIVREMDPTVATFQVYAMADVVGQSQSVFLRRYPLVLVGVFALVALVLALIGTYGVVSYAVAQRLRELGIRIALGARPAGIRWLVLRHAGTLAVLGAGLGIAGAFALARLARSLLFGVGAAEPLIYASVALVLAAMAVAAALVPARRATRVNPILALRAE